MPRARGQCPVCFQRQPLRSNGTGGGHSPYPSLGPCEGAGQWPAVMDVMDCRGCLLFLESRPHLVGAAASVGIRHGKDTDQVVREYLMAYHGRAHQEADR